jgi:hypothetical protein
MFKLLDAEADVEWKRESRFGKLSFLHVRILPSGSIDDFTSSPAVTCTSVPAVNLTRSPYLPSEEDCLGLSPSRSAACAARIKRMIEELWKSEHQTQKHKAPSVSAACKRIVAEIKDCQEHLMNWLMKSIE